jgi:hypothetical protein
MYNHSLTLLAYVYDWTMLLISIGWYKSCETLHQSASISICRMRGFHQSALIPIGWQEVTWTSCHGDLCPSWESSFLLAVQKLNGCFLWESTIWLASLLQNGHMNVRWPTVVRWPMMSFCFYIFNFKYSSLIINRFWLEFPNKIYVSLLHGIFIWVVVEHS